MIWWSKLWISGDVHKSKEILLAIGTRSLEADIYSYNLVLILGQQIARDVENGMNMDEHMMVFDVNLYKLL
jgi:hypothetical protein